jgi:hypothetical protein
MVKARALQQGIADHSIAAAARSPRLREAIATAIVCAGGDPPGAVCSMRHEISPAEHVDLELAALSSSAS